MGRGLPHSFTKRGAGSVGATGVPGAVLCGFLAGWFPWVFFENRTIFSFYSIVFLPFMVMALAMSLGVVLGPSTAPGNRRIVGSVAVGSFVVLAIARELVLLPDLDQPTHSL